MVITLAAFTALFGLIFILLLIITFYTGGDPLSEILLVFCGPVLLVGIISLLLAVREGKQPTTTAKNQIQQSSGPGISKVTPMTVLQLSVLSAFYILVFAFFLLSFFGSYFKDGFYTFSTIPYILISAAVIFSFFFSVSLRNTTKPSVPNLILFYLCGVILTSLLGIAFSPLMGTVLLFIFLSGGLVFLLLVLVFLYVVDYTLQLLFPKFYQWFMDRAKLLIKNYWMYLIYLIVLVVILTFVYKLIFNSQV